MKGLVDVILRCGLAHGLQCPVSTPDALSTALGNSMVKVTMKIWLTLKHSALIGRPARSTLPRLHGVLLPCTAVRLVVLAAAAAGLAAVRAEIENHLLLEPWLGQHPEQWSDQGEEAALVVGRSRRILDHMVVRIHTVHKLDYTPLGRSPDRTRPGSNRTPAGAGGRRSLQQ